MPYDDTQELRSGEFNTTHGLRVGVEGEAYPRAAMTPAGKLMIGPGFVEPLYEASEFLIASEVLSDAAASKTFSSIPQTFSHLRLKVLARTAGGGTGGDNLAVQFNGDFGANYDYVLAQVSNTTDANATSVGQVAITTGVAPRNGDTANKAGLTVIDIPFYALTTFHKVLQYRSVAFISQIATGSFDRTGGGLWRNTAAITSILLIPETGDFMAGSAFSLYGIK